MSWKKVAYVDEVPSNFTDLDDVPSSYSGEAGKFAKVKATEDGLEFGAAAALSDQNPSDVKEQTPGPGIGAEAARYDHIHDIDLSLSKLNEVGNPDGPVAMNSQRLTGLGAVTTEGDAIPADANLRVPDATLLEGSTKTEVQDHTPKAHGLDAHEDPIGPVEFAQQQASGIVLPNATIASPPHPGSEVAGETFFATDDGHAYVWVVA